jgi:hypothetical protein
MTIHLELNKRTLVIPCVVWTFLTKITWWLNMELATKNWLLSSWIIQGSADSMMKQNTQKWLHHITNLRTLASTSIWCVHDLPPSEIDRNPTTKRQPVHTIISPHGKHKQGEIPCKNRTRNRVGMKINTDNPPKWTRIQGYIWETPQGNKMANARRNYNRFTVNMMINSSSTPNTFRNTPSDGCTS